MEILLNSFLLVFAGEMGDKTQLLALILASRYKKPFTVMAGIFVATLVNHALAAWLGAWSSSFLNSEALRWTLGLLFLAFAIWILFPDKESDTENPKKWGAFMTTLVAFFFAEMGDKTQLATIALGAQYQATTLVTIGTTLGMLASNGLAIYVGDKVLKRIPMKYIRIFASLLFAFFGMAILLGFKIAT